MSTRIQYSCPKCNHVLSGYSKKGYPELHTGIGLEYITCDNCSFNISSGLLPWSEMNSLKKLKELLKTGLNIFIISIVFFIIIVPISMFSINSVEKQFLLIIIGLLIFYLYKLIIYIRYCRWVEKQKQNGRNTIPVNEFRQKYPDW